MAHANIHSPEVIKTFRNDYVRFDEDCRQALTGVRSDCHRVTQWLQQEQIRWKQELRKSEDLVQAAKSAYLLARFGAEAYRKTQYVDELKVLHRAEARKAEADRKLAAIKKWGPLLSSQTQKLMGPIDALSATLDSGTPRALAKLDLLVRSLEEYLRPTGTGGAPSGGGASAEGESVG